jgi:hypothetical protein
MALFSVAQMEKEGAATGSLHIISQHPTKHTRRPTTTSFPDIHQQWTTRRINLKPAHVRQADTKPSQSPLLLHSLTHSLNLPNLTPCEKPPHFTYLPLQFLVDIVEILVDLSMALLFRYIPRRHTILRTSRHVSSLHTSSPPPWTWQPPLLYSPIPCPPLTPHHDMQMPLLTEQRAASRRADISPSSLPPTLMRLTTTL